MKVHFVGVCLVLAAATLLAEEGKKMYYCKYCGYKAGSVKTLTANACQRAPGGGRHVLYEGAEKPKYTCKFCGKVGVDIRSLTASKCQRHPAGPAKGYHEPAL